MTDWSQFHFLRPLSLLLMLFIFLIPFLKKRALSLESAWQGALDAHLLAALISNKSNNKRAFLQNILLPIFFILTVLALAGPTYKKRDLSSTLLNQPVIILLELSPAMLASDVSPSRLKRAKFKLEELIAGLKGREIGLIAYSKDAHQVLPLTEDHKTVLSLLADLEPDIMPSPGFSLMSALKLAEKNNSDLKPELIIVSSSHFDEDEKTLVSFIEDNNFRALFWFFASPEGAPMLDKAGNFLKDAKGSAVLSALNSEALKTLSKSPKIRSLVFTPNQNDVKEVERDILSQASSKESSLEKSYDAWEDLGPYLLIVALLFFLLASMKHGSLWIFGSFLLCFAPKVDAFNLFQRQDQQAYNALINNQAEKAALLYEDNFSKGTALYKAGQYEEALKYLSQVQTSEGLYNSGNALAQLKKYPEAIKAYEAALAQDPKNSDARFNKELLEKAQKKEEQEKKEEKQEEKKEEKKEPEPEQEKKAGENKGANQKEESKNQSGEQKGAESQKNKEEKKEAEKPAPDKSEPKKTQENAPEEKAVATQEEKEKIDQSTRYYLEQLENKRSLFLKRKFLHESRKQGAQEP
jgi:Ca-activated chloride channel family protein